MRQIFKKQLEAGRSLNMIFIGVVEVNVFVEGALRRVTGGRESNTQPSKWER